jgi:hypothetical protein
MASEVLRDRRPTGRELEQRPRCKHVLTRPAASHICMPGKDDHPWSPPTGSLATQPRVCAFLASTFIARTSSCSTE